MIFFYVNYIESNVFQILDEEDPEVMSLGKYETMKPSVLYSFSLHFYRGYWQIERRTRS